MEQKIKILYLGVDDNPTPGHAFYAFQHVPPEYEAHLVIKSSHRGNDQYVLYPNRLVRNLKKMTRRNLWTRLQWWFRYGIFPKVDKSRKEYHFKGNELLGYSAKDILRRCPKGFVPDVIAVFWVSGFVSSRMIRQLHELTGAKVVYYCVDEAPLTGGCHYPFECRGFFSDCADCPALLRGKRLASVQLEQKRRNLSKVPLYLSGPAYDSQLARQSAVFKNAMILTVTSKPRVTYTPRDEARRRFSLSADSFVVMMGAMGTQDKRKGFSYAAEALNEAAQQIPNLVVLVAGNANDELRQRLQSVNCQYVGVLSLDDLYKAFCAADVFLSSTIADSGPMMVNMASALGTPTVAFPVGVAVSLVRHQETGYKARYKDSADLAAGLRYLHSLSVDEWTTMSQRCRLVLDEEAARGTSLQQLLKDFR